MLSQGAKQKGTRLYVFVFSSFLVEFAVQLLRNPKIFHSLLLRCWQVLTCLWADFITTLTTFCKPPCVKRRTGWRAVDTKALVRFYRRCGSGSSSCINHCSVVSSCVHSCVGLLTASVLCIPPRAHITHSESTGGGQRRLLAFCCRPRSPKARLGSDQLQIVCSQNDDPNQISSFFFIYMVLFFSSLTHLESFKDQCVDSLSFISFKLIKRT